VKPLATAISHTFDSNHIGDLCEQTPVGISNRSLSTMNWEAKMIILRDVGDCFVGAGKIYSTDSLRPL